jgi:hypothetical protein
MSFADDPPYCSVVRYEKNRILAYNYIMFFLPPPSTAPEYSPFLLNNFFQVALHMRNGRYSSDESYDDRLKPTKTGIKIKVI